MHHDDGHQKTLKALVGRSNARRNEMAELDWLVETRKSEGLGDTIKATGTTLDSAMCVTDLQNPWQLFDINQLVKRRKRSEQL